MLGLLRTTDHVVFGVAGGEDLDVHDAASACCRECGLGCNLLGTFQMVEMKQQQNTNLRYISILK